jgi:hypothetical protein
MRARGGRSFRTGGVFLVLCLWCHAASAQTLAQRGFVDGSGFFYPQVAPNDDVRGVADLLVRDEVFAKPASWLQLAGGIEVRANSHGQVDDSWSLDWSDRGILRPRLSVRRASATISKSRLTLDVGKQFIRWGKTDIVTPTDRFAPRDFVNVVDTNFLAVTGVRGVFRVSDADSLEAVWVPRFTPSRLPLLGQRWTPVPPGVPVVVVGEGTLPDGAQAGVRWSHVGPVEFSASFFDGYNHLPTFDVRTEPVPVDSSVVAVAIRRIYPAIRTYGADVAVPTPWFTIKGEAAYFSSAVADEYLLFVVQVERQTGEWVFVGGYAGEAVTTRRAPFVFAPDRGLTDAIVARASFTIDTNRSLAVETAIRQNLQGEYLKAEFSQARGQHWRVTVAGIFIGGEPDDFLGQYSRNSHVSLVLRYSF